VSVQIVFRPQAEGEALEVRHWYESRSSGLGNQFTAALEGLIARIAAAPDAFPRIHGETRRAVFRRFPYAIYFRVAGDTAVVLAIHGRQHPSNWQGRS
jgi:plasmid stabilization system protein ParE